MCNSVAIHKQDDPASRLEGLLDRFEPEFAVQFLSLIERVRDNLNLEEISRLIEVGRTQEAIDQLENALIRFSDIVVTATITSGQDTAELLTDVLNVLVSFDQTNQRAVNAMRDNRLRLIRELSASQRDALRESLVDGLRRGVNPRQTAIELRNSIGLTQRQVQAVNSYRRALETGSLSALSRELRDRRFDATVRRAARGDTVLTQVQIDRMVQRYSERLLAFRAEVIGRTEALRAIHQGSELMYEQAIQTGQLNPDRLIRTWVTAGDSRVRESHNGMSGQQRAFGEPFISDAGNELRYPGDINAPASETIQCRCVITTRLLPIGDA